MGPSWCERGTIVSVAILSVAIVSAALVSVATVSVAIVSEGLEAREDRVGTDHLNQRADRLSVRARRAEVGDATGAEGLVCLGAEPVEDVDVLRGHLEGGALDQPADLLAGRVAENKAEVDVEVVPVVVEHQVLVVPGQG